MIVCGWQACERAVLLPESHLCVVAVDPERTQPGRQADGMSREPVGKHVWLYGESQVNSGMTADDTPSDECASVISSEKLHHYYPSSCRVIASLDRDGRFFGAIHFNDDGAIVSVVRRMLTERVVIMNGSPPAGSNRFKVRLVCDLVIATPRNGARVVHHHGCHGERRFSRMVRPCHRTDCQFHSASDLRTGSRKRTRPSRSRRRYIVLMFWIS